MAGVDPGVVVVAVKDLLKHSAIQGVEIFRRPRATNATREPDKHGWGQSLDANYFVNLRPGVYIRQPFVVPIG